MDLKQPAEGSCLISSSGTCVPTFILHEDGITAAGLDAPYQHHHTNQGSPLEFRVEACQGVGGVNHYVLMLSVGVGHRMNRCDMEWLMEEVIMHIRDIVGGSATGGKEKDIEGHKAGNGVTTAQDKALPYPVIFILQSLGIGIMGFVSSIMLLVVWPAVQCSLEHWGLSITLLLVPLTVHTISLLTCLEVILIKAIIGVPPPGSYAINSWDYIRWWFITRLVSFIEPLYIDSMRGTLMHLWWWRALGASVGQGVRCDLAKVTDPDLVVIEDHVTMDTGVKLQTSIIKNGMLHRGRIEVGRCAVMGSCAMMLPGSRLDDGSTLEVGAVVEEGQTILSGGVYAGAPAAFVRPCGAGPIEPVVRSRAYELLLLILQGLVPLVVTTVAAAMAYEPMTMLLEWQGVFDFFHWRGWQEGRILFCLFANTGIASTFMAAITLKSMTLCGSAMQFTHTMVEDGTKLIGYSSLPVSVIKDLLRSESGCALLRQYLPPGVTLTGKAGSSDLQLCGPGR